MVNERKMSKHKSLDSKKTLNIYYLDRILIIKNKMKRYMNFFHFNSNSNLNQEFSQIISGNS